MKELLIFLLLIFFIEIKTQNEELTSIPDEKTISKPNEEPSKEPSKRVNNCLKGFFFINCPKGFRSYGGKCCNEAPVKCRGGKVLDNKCICPARKKLISGQCIRI